MTLVIPTGFAQATFVMRASGDPEPWNCTLGVDVSGAGGDYDAVLTRLNYSWETWILPGQSNIVTLVGTRLTVGQDGADPLIIDQASGAEGGIDGDFLPQNSAVLIRKNSGIGGRKNRGRMYVPLLVTSGQVDNVGVINSTTITGLQAQADDFFDQLNDPTTPSDTPAPPVILHNAGLGPALAPTEVTSLTVQGVIATQRRRLR